MPRTISSSLTILYKFILPGIFLVLFIMNVVDALRGQFYIPPDATFPFIILIAVLAIVWIVFIVWSMVKLKRVRVDQDFLYVSDYFKETQIPLRDIYDVTEFRWVNIHPVTIHLKKPSELGDKIVFAPPYRHFGFFTSDPIVDELKQLAWSKSQTGFLTNPSPPKMFH